MSLRRAAATSLRARRVQLSAHVQITANSQLRGMASTPIKDQFSLENFNPANSLAPELEMKWYKSRPRTPATPERQEEILRAKQVKINRKEQDMDDLLTVLKDYLEREDAEPSFLSETGVEDDLELAKSAHEASARIRLLCQFADNMSQRDYAKFVRCFEKYYLSCKRTALLNYFEKQGARVPSAFNLAIGLDDSVDGLSNLRPTEKTHHKVTFVRQVMAFLDMDVCDSALPRFISNINSFTLSNFYEAMELSEDISSRKYIAAVVPDAVLASDKPDKSIYDNIQYQDEAISEMLSGTICKPENMVVLQFTSYTISVRDILRTLSAYGVVLAVELFRNSSNGKQANENRDTLSAASSPCFAHVYFRDNDAVQKILTPDLRCFGISIQKHTVYPSPRDEHRILMISRIPINADISAVKSILLEFADDVISLDNIEHVHMSSRLSVYTGTAFIRFDTHASAAKAYKAMIQRNQSLKEALSLWVESGNPSHTFSHYKASRINVSWALGRNLVNPGAPTFVQADYFRSIPGVAPATYLSVGEVHSPGYEHSILKLWDTSDLVDLSGPGRKSSKKDTQSTVALEDEMEIEDDLEEDPEVEEELDEIEYVSSSQELDDGEMTDMPSGTTAGIESDIAEEVDELFRP